MRLNRLKWALRVAALAFVIGGWLAAPAVATSQTVVIQNFTFGPQNVTINVRESVTWSNKDPLEHTATSDAGVFDTGTIPSLGSKTITFSAAGTYAYHCTFHSFMQGTVTVLGPAPTTAPPPPPTPAPRPTPSPTVPPTAPPTAPPTQAPTPSPSPSPVATASPSPSPSPTPAPIATPTATPSSVAAASPTLAPSAGPDGSAGPGPILAAGGLVLAAALAVLAIYLYRRR